MKTQNEHLAIASVPVQSWGELYSQDEALRTGTIFKELDKPFFAAEQITAPLSFSGDLLKSPEEQKCDEKMLEIQKTSFVMDDLRLYLDTHPEDQDALVMLKEIMGRRIISLYAVSCPEIHNASQICRGPSDRYWYRGTGTYGNYLCHGISAYKKSDH